MLVRSIAPPAAAFALGGAMLPFFGLMHRAAIGIGKMPMMELGYLVVAAGLYACARCAAVALQQDAVAGEAEHDKAPLGQARSEAA